MTTTTIRISEKPDYTPKQRRLIEQHRDINTYRDWWDCTYDDFIETAKAKGFETTAYNIQFSGFWLQGDGASFTGSVDVTKFIAYVKAENAALVAEGKTAPLDPYPWVDKLLGAGGRIYVTVERTSHRYAHANTCRAWVDNFDYFGDVIPTHGDETREEVLHQWTIQLQSDVTQLEKDIEVTRYALCGELYQSLKTEYEGLTSDGAVWEAIVDNEFDQEGDDDNDDDQ